MVLAAARYVLAGLFVGLIGALFFGDAMSFASRSVPAELRVISIQSRIDDDHTDGHARQRYIYRPVFALKDAGTPAPSYVGNVWMHPAPHRAGDVVPGRYDAASGEMRSDKMQGISVWLGTFAMVLGVLIALQSLALLHGVPEDNLPLRVRFGGSHRSSPGWQ